LDGIEFWVVISPLIVVILGYLTVRELNRHFTPSLEYIKHRKVGDAMMDKPLSFYAFEMLYWCGIRLGVFLALIPVDFNFDKSTVMISKSYQRINKEDVIT